MVLAAPNEPRRFYLPRLSAESYRGTAVVHWVLTIFNRKTGWLNESFHLRFRELMLHAAVREGLFCPAYCLMPDHIHLVWMGVDAESDQRNGMAFLRTHLKPLLVPHRLQHQACDHVLREEDRRKNAFMKVCAYIRRNPARARLIKDSETWPYEGAIIPGYAALEPSGFEFWPRFWKIYYAAVQRSN